MATQNKIWPSKQCMNCFTFEKGRRCLRVILRYCSKDPLLRSAGDCMQSTPAAARTCRARVPAMGPTAISGPAPTLCRLCKAGSADTAFNSGDGANSVCVCVCVCAGGNRANTHLHVTHTQRVQTHYPHAAPRNNHTHTRWEPRDKNKARKAVERKLLRNSRAVLDVFRSGEDEGNGSMFSAGQSK